VAILFKSSYVLFFMVAYRHDSDAMATGGQAADQVVWAHADEVGDVRDEVENIHEKICMFLIVDRGFGVGEWKKRGEY
jgi:hypothetical protein